MCKLTILLLSILLVSCDSSFEKKEKYIVANNTFSNTTQNELEESIARGEGVYNDFCVSCHLPSGIGVDTIFPPLAASDYLLNERMKSIRAVKYGQQGKIIVNGKSYNTTMAPMGLENDEVADVMNYVMNSWGNAQDKMVTPEEVAAVEK